MPVTRIAMVSERAASGRVKALYAEIKAGMGTPNVPEVFRAMSQSPELLAAMWLLFQRLMLAESQLPRATKEMIAVVVSTISAYSQELAIDVIEAHSDPIILNRDLFVGGGVFKIQLYILRISIV